MKYQVAFGRKMLSVDVDPGRVVGTLCPRAVKPVADVQAAVAKALRSPIGCDGLDKLATGCKSALIITVDHTRPSPRPMLLPILEVCRRKGLSVSIIIATGRHRAMTPDELHRHLGPDILSSCRILQHDAFDTASMVDKGVTSRGTRIMINKAVFEHPLVIGCGIIEPSYLCGWSGGRKLLMPGLAHHESVDNNHYHLTQPGAEIGALDGNPVSEDSFEFARDLPLHFIVYSVSGPNDETTRIVAGHWIDAHRAGCDLARQIYATRLKQADIVISSAGGWPYDCDLVQGKKAIIPAIKAVKPNGVIILAAECPDGLGAEKTFVAWLRGKTPLEVTQDVLDRRQFSLGAHGANILARPIVQKNARVIMVTNPAVAAQLKGTYLIPATSMAKAWQLANMIAGDDASVLFIEKARRLILTAPAASARALAAGKPAIRAKAPAGGKARRRA